MSSPHSPTTPAAPGTKDTVDMDSEHDCAPVEHAPEDDRLSDGAAEVANAVVASIEGAPHERAATGAVNVKERRFSMFQSPEKTPPPAEGSKKRMAEVAAKERGKRKRAKTVQKWVEESGASADQEMTPKIKPAAKATPKKVKKSTPTSSSKKRKYTDSADSSVSTPSKVQSTKFIHYDKTSKYPGAPKVKLAPKPVTTKPRTPKPVATKPIPPLPLRTSVSTTPLVPRLPDTETVRVLELIAHFKSPNTYLTRVVLLHTDANAAIDVTELQNEALEASKDPYLITVNRTFLHCIFAIIEYHYGVTNLPINDIDALVRSTKIFDDGAELLHLDLKQRLPFEEGLLQSLGLESTEGISIIAAEMEAEAERRATQPIVFRSLDGKNREVLNAAQGIRERTAGLSNGMVKQ